MICDLQWAMINDLSEPYLALRTCSFNIFYYFSFLIHKALVGFFLAKFPIFFINSSTLSPKIATKRAKSKRKFPRIGYNEAILDSSLFATGFKWVYGALRGSVKNSLTTVIVLKMVEGQQYPRQPSCVTSGQMLCNRDVSIRPAFCFASPKSSKDISWLQN